MRVRLNESLSSHSEDSLDQNIIQMTAIVGKSSSLSRYSRNKVRLLAWSEMHWTASALLHEKPCASAVLRSGTCSCLSEYRCSSVCLCAWRESTRLEDCIGRYIVFVEDSCHDCHGSSSIDAAIGSARVHRPSSFASVPSFVQPTLLFRSGSVVRWPERQRIQSHHAVGHRIASHRITSLLEQSTRSVASAKG